MTTERWALVPVEATSEMISAGWESGKLVCDTRIINSVSDVWAAMIQASPGAALLAEIYAARDAFYASKGAIARVNAAYEVLSVLDKLGPAAEVEAPSPAEWNVEAIYEAFKTWPDDIRRKLSFHDLRRMNGWVPPKPTPASVPDGLIDRIKAAELRTLAHKAGNLVPGVMHCAKCKLRLHRTTLYMGSGTTGAGDSKTEPCPNGCGPLWPVTWEQEAREAMALVNGLHEQLQAAQQGKPDHVEDKLGMVPAEANEWAFEDKKHMRGDYAAAAGWNACRDAMLATCPTPDHSAGVGAEN